MPALARFQRGRRCAQHGAGHRAEEILASNFERLVLDERDVPSPEVLARIRAELVQAVDR